MNQLTETEQERCYELFDDIQDDAVKGTNTDDKDKARILVQSILEGVCKLQELLK